jgi:hypothetical protein
VSCHFFISAAMDSLKDVSLKELKEGTKLEGAENYVLWLFKIWSLMIIKRCWSVVETQTVIPDLPASNIPSLSSDAKEEDSKHIQTLQEEHESQVARINAQIHNICAAQAIAIYIIQNNVRNQILFHILD